MKKLDVIFRVSEKAFSAEARHAEHLTGKAEKYVGALAAVVALQLVDLNRVTAHGTYKVMIPVWFAIGAMAALGISLILALLSMRVRKYFTYPVGKAIVDQLKADTITNEDAQYKIALMYFDAQKGNARINSVRAKTLSVSGALLVLGFLLAVASQLAVRFIG